MVDPIEGEELDPDNPPVYGWRDAPVSGERVDLHEGPIVAGDPVGARVEVTETGLRAYDSTGTETASIAGEGGEFVGGSFRTSNVLPGQVVLSDTANQGEPGISIEPADDTGYDSLPSIGPGPDDMRISGGVSTAGDIAGAQFRAGGTNLYWNGPGATGGGAWATVDDGEAGLRYRPDRTNAFHESAIRARANDAVVYSEGPNGTGFFSASPLGALLEHVSPGDPTARSESRAFADPEYLMLERKVPGVTDRHRLILDDDGVWVQTVNSLVPVSYNLLNLLTDTGRTEFPTVAGVTRPVPPTWRNKANMILFNGTVNKAWTVGWNSVAIGMPLVTRPEIEEVRNAPIPEPGYLLRITPGGALDVYAPSAGARDVRLSGLTYPLG